jgi:outer membrane protein assembly factor BamB
MVKAFGIFSEKWSFPVVGSLIAPHALDSVDQTVYVGETETVGRTNFLYALSIVDGSVIWRYNTSLPVNYVSHFNSNGDCFVIAGTGRPQATAGYVYCFNLLDNVTRWISAKLNSSVVSLGSAESYVATGGDVVAGLENGTVVRLRGDNGAVLWGYPCNGAVIGVTDLESGSIVIGTRQTTPKGYVYCLGKNGTFKWVFSKDDSLTLVKRFSDVNGDGESEVIAIFATDGLIHVLDGKTGEEVLPWPFNNNGDNIKDFLCTEDYSGDGFPDIVCGTEGGNLTIVNGRDATPFRKSLVRIGRTVTYIQYMYFYEDGVAYSNKALAVSLLDFNSTSCIYGVNASDLTLIKQFKTTTTARNLFHVGNFSSTFVGDLLFTVNNVVYCISGTEIIVSEFSSQILVFIVIVVFSLTAVLPRKRFLRKAGNE